MVCYATQKETDEAISQNDKVTEWYAETHQNRYVELSEGRSKDKER